MIKLTIAIGSTFFLLAAGSAFADHHEDAAAANNNPSHETCMQMHETMMQRHKAGEDHETIMAGMSPSDRDQMNTCRQMMEEMHGQHEMGDAMQGMPHDADNAPQDTNTQSGESPDEHSGHH